MVNVRGKLMDPELVKLVVVNAPNYLGFILLAYQQSKIINALLQIVTRGQTEDE